MLNRREFAGLLAALPAGRAWAQNGRVPFYNCTGTELSFHALDVAAAEIAALGAVTLPANVQYAWPHPSRRFFYVASSDGTAGSSSGPGAAGSRHAATAFRVDAATGALTPHGTAAALAARPIHLSVSPDGRFLLVAYNSPSRITVHRIGADGTLGAEVPQPEGLDFGIYAHQVRATPGGRTVTLVTRGNDPAPNKPEDPGAIKVFRFQDGRLSNLASIAPGNGPEKGIGFGPRHLDFHPALPLAAVSLERQNALYVYGLNVDGALGTEPRSRTNTLADPRGKELHPGQGAGPIHFHPDGRALYVANRGSGSVQFEGRRVSDGGENSIAVFAIDPATGTARHLQSIDARGFEIRTFTIDPGGTLLIAASQASLATREGGRVNAGLSFFRIAGDGQLTFLRRQDVDTAKGSQFWCGTLTMS